MGWFPELKDWPLTHLGISKATEWTADLSQKMSWVGPDVGYSLRLRFLGWLDTAAAAAAAESLQSCLTLCDPIDGSAPGSPIPGILQGKNTGVGCHFLLQCMKVKSEVAQSLSRVRPLATPWTATYQAPPSRGFSRQEYRSGVPLPSPGWWDKGGWSFSFAPAQHPLLLPLHTPPYSPLPMCSHWKDRTPTPQLPPNVDFSEGPEVFGCS